MCVSSKGLSSISAMAWSRYSTAPLRPSEGSAWSSSSGVRRILAIHQVAIETVLKRAPAAAAAHRLAQRSVSQTTLSALLRGMQIQNTCTGGSAASVCRVHTFRAHSRRI